MRLHKIWISKYKNIRNLKLDFKSDHLITLLVGQNGLGKSNLIEILTLIFRDIDLIHDEDEFNDWPYRKNHFEYEIEYRCHAIDIKIDCKEGAFSVYEKNHDRFEAVEFKRFIRDKKKKYLPDYIIGYYSGENKRVRELIKPHEKVEVDFIKYWQRRKSDSTERGIRRLFFTESSHSQLVLLTLSVYQNIEEFKKPIRKLLKKYLKIDKFSEFTIKFSSPIWYNRRNRTDGIDYMISNMVYSTDGLNAPNPFWGLKGKIDRLLTDLYNLQIEEKEPLMYQDDKNKQREIIEFNSINLQKFSQIVQTHFPHPIDFFYALEATAIIGSLRSIKIRIKKTGQADDFEYEEMSEGEQQLLTVLGIVLITGKEDCLLLFDEPDTHLNPKWQRDYVHMLREFDINSGESHMIVSTHSPLIVQSSQDANLVLFQLNSKGVVKAKVTDIPFHTWRIDHVLTSPYFGLESARPKDAKLDTFMKRRQEILSKEKITVKDEKELSLYMDDFNLLPTGETFSDLKAMNVVYSVANDKNK